MKKILRTLAAVLVVSMLLVNFAALAESGQNYVVNGTLATVLCTSDDFSSTNMMKYGDTRALFALAIYLDCKVDETVQSLMPEDLPTFYIASSDGYIYIPLFFEKAVWLLTVDETSGLTIASSLDGQNLTFDDTTTKLVMDTMVTNGVFASYEKITLTELTTAMDELSKIFSDAE